MRFERHILTTIDPTMSAQIRFERYNLTIWHSKAAWALTVVVKLDQVLPQLWVLRRLFCAELSQMWLQKLPLPIGAENGSFYKIKLSQTYMFFWHCSKPQKAKLLHNTQWAVKSHLSTQSCSHIWFNLTATVSAQAAFVCWSKTTWDYISQCSGEIWTPYSDNNCPQLWVLR